MPPSDLEVRKENESGGTLSRGLQDSENGYQRFRVNIQIYGRMNQYA